MPGHQVILGLGVEEVHGRLHVAAPAVAQHGAVGVVELAVPERHLAPGVDGALDDVEVAEHRVLLALDAPLHVQALHEALGGVAAAELGDARHEAGAGLLGEEAARLHRVGQKQQLLGLEVALDHGIARRGAVAELAHVQAELAQGLQIDIERLALHAHSAQRKLLDDLRRRESVLRVGALQHDLRQVEHLELVLRLVLLRLRHGRPLRFAGFCWKGW